MELLLKLGITAVVGVFIYYQVLFLRFVWTSQIDPTETIARFFRQLSPQPDVIATRDPSGIYQDGKKVGEVTGHVETREDTVVFEQLSETTGPTVSVSA